MTSSERCIICGSLERITWDDGAETCAHCNVRLDVDYFPESDLVTFSQSLQEFGRTLIEATRIEQLLRWLSRRLERK